MRSKTIGNKVRERKCRAIYQPWAAKQEKYFLGVRPT